MLDRRLQELIGAARIGDPEVVLELGGELARAGRTGAAVHALTRLEAEGPPPARPAARRLRREALQVARESRGELTLRRIQVLDEPITALGFRPDAAGLAVGTAQGTVALLDGHGELVASAKAMTQGVSSLDFSLCGSALGAGQGHGKPMVLDPRSLHPRRSMARARGWVTAVLPGKAGTVVVAAGEWFRHWLFGPDASPKGRPLPDLQGLPPPWAASRPEDLAEAGARLRDQVDLASMLLDGTPEGPRRPAFLRSGDEMLIGDPHGETLAVFHRGRLYIFDLDATEPGPLLRLAPDVPRHGWEDQGAPTAALSPGGSALLLGSPCYAPRRNAWSRLHRYRPGSTCLVFDSRGPRVLRLLEDEAVSAVAAAPDGDGFALGTEDGVVYRLSATNRGGDLVDLAASRPPPRAVPDLRVAPGHAPPRPAEFDRLARLYLDLELPTRVALDDRFLWVEHLRFEDDWSPGSYLLFDLSQLEEGPAALVSSPPGHPPLVLEDLLGVGEAVPPPPPVTTWAMGARARLNQQLMVEHEVFWGAPDGRRAAASAFVGSPEVAIVDLGGEDSAAALRIGGSVRFCAFSPGGSLVAILTDTARVEIWGPPGVA